jgi:hypothetical protein
MKRILIIAILSLSLLYGGDYLALRYRMAKNTGLGSVTIQRYYAVKQKDGRTEFMFTDPLTQGCVNSWFPHRGYTPCWYLVRHKTKRIDM